MKQNWKITRFALLEVILSVAMIAVALMTFFAMVAPQSRHRTSAMRVSSVNMLKQVSFAFRIRTQDYLDKFPADASSANGKSP